MSRFPGQCCLEYDKTIKILSKTVTGLRGLVFHAIPWGLETANGGFLHVSGHVVNQNPVTMAA